MEMRASGALIGVPVIVVFSSFSVEATMLEKLVANPDIFVVTCCSWKFSNVEFIYIYIYMCVCVCVCV